MLNCTEDELSGLGGGLQTMSASILVSIKMLNYTFQ